MHIYTTLTAKMRTSHNSCSLKNVVFGHENCSMAHSGTLGASGQNVVHLDNIVVNIPPFFSHGAIMINGADMTPPSNRRGQYHSVDFNGKTAQVKGESLSVREPIGH